MSTRSYERHSALPSPFLVKGAGVYAILNRGNGKIYIGSSTRLNHRWTEHRMELEKRKHGNRYLQSAFNLTPDAFCLEVIEELAVFTKELLLSREQFWMNFYRSWLPKNGYNIAPKAESCLGIKHGPEYGKSISDRQKGRKMSPERLAQHTAAVRGHKGRSFTPQQREEARRRKKDTRDSEATKKRKSDAHKIAPYQSRPVIQFSVDGQFIRQFKMIVDAEIEFGRRTNIHSACTGKRRSACGFIWRYACDVKPNELVTARPCKQRGPKRKEAHG